MNETKRPQLNGAKQKRKEKYYLSKSENAC